MFFRSLLYLSLFIILFATSDSFARRKKRTNHPTHFPTNLPTMQPTNAPTNEPTFQPTNQPTVQPTNPPTFQPTFQPTNPPTFQPTNKPTNNPTAAPTPEPTQLPTSPPTNMPSSAPTHYPYPFCRPQVGLNKKTCDKLIKKCAGVNVKMKWNGHTCIPKKEDSGCQCDGYCGYGCPKPCKADPQCTWNYTDGSCYNKITGQIGGPIDPCTAS